MKSGMICDACQDTYYLIEEGDEFFIGEKVYHEGCAECCDRCGGIYLMDDLVEVFAPMKDLGGEADRYHCKSCYEEHKHLVSDYSQAGRATWHT